MPTWESIKLFLDEEGSFFQNLQWAYPRYVLYVLFVFHLCPAMSPANLYRGMLTEPVRSLRGAILARLSAADSRLICMMFPTSRSCLECMEGVNNAKTRDGQMDIVRFFIPRAQHIAWTEFLALLYDPAHEKHIMDFWRDSGKVISPRHAQYCADNLHLMATDSLNSSFTAPAYSPLTAFVPLPDAASVGYAVRSLIASLVTSEQPGQAKIDPADVFLYPTGMTAVYTLSQACASLFDEPVVVTFG